MLQKLLSVCEFSKREQEVLAYLLQRKASTASLIAKRTCLKRPTVYAILESLLITGLVVKQRRNKVTYFSIASPQLLPEMIESRARKKYDNIRDATHMIREYLEHAARQHEQDFAGFDISSLESHQAVYQQLEAALLGGDYCAIFNPQIAMVGEGKRLIAEFLSKTSLTKPHIREIIVDGRHANWYLDHIKNENHHVKRIPPQQEVLTDIICIEGQVVLSHYGAQEENAIRIIQPDFYRTLMTVFELLWVSLA